MIVSKEIFSGIKDRFLVAPGVKGICKKLSKKMVHP